MRLLVRSSGVSWASLRMECGSVALSRRGKPNSVGCSFSTGLFLPCGGSPEVNGKTWQGVGAFGSTGFSAQPGSGHLNWIQLEEPTSVDCQAAAVKATWDTPIPSFYLLSLDPVVRHFRPGQYKWLAALGAASKK